LKGKPIADFGEHWLPFLEDMFDTCHTEDGAGLAAPQIGESLQLCVVILRGAEGEEPNKLAFFNPEIIKSDGECVYEEGCLSLPGIREEVTRPQKIVVRYQDYSGNSYELEIEGLLARILQHEIDHLNGVLLIDRLSPVKRIILKPKLKKIAAGEFVEDDR
jgi:peptide deformylase